MTKSNAPKQKLPAENRQGQSCDKPMAVRIFRTLPVWEFSRCFGHPCNRFITHIPIGNQTVPFQHAPGCILWPPHTPYSCKTPDFPRRNERKYIVSLPRAPSPMSWPHRKEFCRFRTFADPRKHECLSDQDTPVMGQTICLSQIQTLSIDRLDRHNRRKMRHTQNRRNRSFLGDRRSVLDIPLPTTHQ